MRLYVIRHADAADPAEYRTDEERPLTPVGYAQVKRLATALPKHTVLPSVVLTSPLVRARQTAEGLLSGWKPRPSLQECRELAPGGASDELATLLAGHVGDVAIVGHNPDLEKHIAWLIGSRKAQVTLAKAAVACLVCEPPLRKGCAALRWLVTPEFCQGV